MQGTWLQRWGPAIQASGAVLGAAIIAYGANQAAGRFDPKFVRVGDHVFNIEHLVEIAREDVGDGCKIILSISGSRILESSDGQLFTQQLAGHDIDGTACDVLREALSDYAIDGRPLLVPRSRR